MAFCYLCERLDHSELDCSFTTSPRNGLCVRQYGPWLRAEVPSFSLAFFEYQGMPSTDDRVFPPQSASQGPSFFFNFPLMG